ncbi:MAG: SufE family protein [Chlamydiae bacterium]|nr:SufE family protein [Chlamydiota bacterium]
MEIDFAQCLKRQEDLKEFFPASLTSEEKYFKIISFGSRLSAFPPEEKKEENRITGCQSITFLIGQKEEGKIFFKAYSEALITKGVIALLIEVYQGQTPETILKCPPHFLQTLGIFASLSPTRAQGLKSFYEKMLKIAVKNFSLS